ncbi:ATP-binding cassette domain-containing protein [Schaalia cardiffensis]|uniref:ABC transporter ATP-binding protein n=1 Tax=Schaalia cardiffensis TaxID=181487 RepID=UPI0018E8E207|nr:ATP-binding cassette domain-containing protein [Schaalia cardiffensis]MBJ2328727.1 ATP-binding cassette domain-containing protein [Schaalia cardiffensis]
MIRFEHVSHTFPDGTSALEDVSLEVGAHTTTVLLGSSGSGKTTLMRMVNRMISPSSGRVLVRGEDVAAMDPVKLRRSIGYVLQDAGLFPHRNVADNIATVPRLEGASRRAARARALELMELVGLEPALARRYPSQLSGGQRQRVGVARALANKADILLMDEPFGALDPLVRADLQAEIRRLRDSTGTTILFVTHDLDEAFILGDTIAVLAKGGRLAQVGTGPELVANPADDFVASFVSSQASRSLNSIATPAGQLVTDPEGRPLGLLAHANPDSPSHTSASPTHAEEDRAR